MVFLSLFFAYREQMFHIHFVSNCFTIIWISLGPQKSRCQHGMTHARGLLGNTWKGEGERERERARRAIRPRCPATWWGRHSASFPLSVNQRVFRASLYKSWINIHTWDRGWFMFVCFIFVRFWNQCHLVSLKRNKLFFLPWTACLRFERTDLWKWILALLMMYFIVTIF